MSPTTATPEYVAPTLLPDENGISSFRRGLEPNSASMKREAARVPQHRLDRRQRESEGTECRRREADR